MALGVAASALVRRSPSREDGDVPTTSPKPSFPLKTAWLLMAIAATAAVTAIVISTDAWAGWFHHPARQPRPEVTQQGAAWWRIMLGVLAVTLVVFPLLYRHWRDSATVDHMSSDGQPFASQRGGLIIVTVIVAVALLFRCTRIHESLWYDEIASWLSYGVGVHLPGPIVGNYFDPVNHVFHTLLSWCSVNVLELTTGPDLALRVPALLFSLAGVPMMFALGRAAAGPRAGIISASLAAITPVAVLEGVEARGYSMMIFFAGLATTLFWRWLRQPSLGLACLYALCCALGIWSHFVTAFVPVGHGAWLLWRAVRYGEWPRFRLGVGMLAFSAIITITLYAPMIPDMLEAKRMFFSSRGDEPTLFGAEGRHALMQLGGSWYWWAALPGLLLGMLGILSCRRREAARTIVALAFIGLPLMVIMVVVSGSWIYARFTFFALPGGLLLIALGVDALWSRSRAGAISAILVMLGVAVADLALRPPKQPLREAAMFVRNLRQSSDRVLAIGLAHEVLRVYASDLPLTYRLSVGRQAETPLAASRPEWIIIEYPNSLPEATWQALATAGYVIEARFEGWVDWTNGDVVVMKLANSGG